MSTYDLPPINTTDGISIHNSDSYRDRWFTCPFTLIDRANYLGKKDIPLLSIHKWNYYSSTFGVKMGLLKFYPLHPKVFFPYMKDIITKDFIYFAIHMPKQEKYTFETHKYKMGSVNLDTGCTREIYVLLHD